MVNGLFPLKSNGFFEMQLTWPTPCVNPQHNPPMHLYIPAGQGYSHTCPGCGAHSVLFGATVTY